MDVLNKERFFGILLLSTVLFTSVGICSGNNKTLHRSEAQVKLTCCQACKCKGSDVFCDEVLFKTLPLDCPANTTLLSLVDCGLTELKDGQLGHYYEHLQSLNISGNNITMELETFAGLLKLQVLNIGSNVYSMKNIHPLLFSRLPNIRHIEWTSLGDRSLDRGVEIVMNTFQGLENSSIETIILKNMNQHPFALKKSHLKYLRNSPVQRLVLKRFYMTEFEIDLFQYIPHIEEFDFSMNTLQMPQILQMLPYLLFKLAKLKRVIVTDNLKRRGSETHEIFSKKQAEFAYPFPRSVEEIDLSRSVCSVNSYLLSYGAKVESNNHLKIVRFSNMKLFQKVGNKVLGFIHLKELYLDGAESEIFSSVVTCQKGAFESLEILNIAHNYIKWASANETELILTNCTKLRVLDISYNGLDSVPSKMLTDTLNLRSLNLSGNNLKTINLELHGLTSLRILNISNNKLEILPERFLEEINILKTHQSIVLDVSGNPFVCGCRSFEFIEWMQRNSYDIGQWKILTCTYYNGSTVHMHSINILALKLSCWCDVILAGTIPSGILLLAILIVVIAYKRRYKLHYLYLQLRATLRYHGKDNLDHEFNFDGFISYSSLDKNWGQKTLYAKLVGFYKYRICIDDNNFKPGGYISDIILDAIQRSKKVILIISQNFLRSRWCAYEMNLARGELANRGRDCLILILKEPISVLPPELISPTLKSLLDTRVYLEWTDNADRQAVFWRKLRDALGEPIQQGAGGRHIDSPFLTAQTEEDEHAVQNFIAQCQGDNDDERPLL